ncbi:MAG: LysE family transporter [Elusimicrobia bacterium]|jgi:threonine/homoserine/homoserine lactone efflux protein|nr:LysE family transporter [Elusimicrobiota bacterium]
MFESFVKGCCAGLLFSLPAGPAGILVLRSWIRHGQRGGLLATAGMAFAEGLVAGVAAWGLHVASPALRDTSGFLHGVAGVLLVVTGIGFLFFEKDEKRLGHGERPTWRFIWPAGLVLTNPGLWAAYGSLLLAMKTRTPTMTEALATGAGAGFGVILFWGALGSSVQHWKRKKKFNEAHVTLVADRATGYLLIALGLVELWL